MKALVCVGAPDLVELRDVPAPVAERGEVLVQVEAVSVNRGEVHRLMNRDNIGWQPGWDFAGSVIRGADGHIRPGSRVFGMLVEGGWAEQIAVPVGQLATIPDGMSWETAAALPVAGLTALRTLRLRGEDLSGQYVLVLGAAGGVGRLAVQLARRAGAHVTAVVGRPERARGIRELGAHDIVLDLDRQRRRFDLILESVGGPTLRDVLDLVAPRGLVVSYGNSSQAQTTFSISDFYPKQAAIRGFYLLYEIVRDPPAADLTHLADLCVSGELVVDVAAVADWADAANVLDDLHARRLAGKAVLRPRWAEGGPDGGGEHATG